MKVMRPSLLAVAVVLGSLGVACSTAQAQDGGRAVATYPRSYVAYQYPSPATRLAPTYRRQYASPRYAPQRTVIVPHAVRDWSTGNENLPLAKPWLHNFR